MKNNLTVTFFSNFLLHHQTPFCEAMIKRIGDGFHFVATEPTPEDRINMGYSDYSNVPYVIYSYRNNNEYKKALDRNDMTKAKEIEAPHRMILLRRD